MSLITLLLVSASPASRCMRTTCTWLAQLTIATPSQRSVGSIKVLEIDTINLLPAKQIEKFICEIKHLVDLNHVSHQQQYIWRQVISLIECTKGSGGDSTKQRW